MQLVPRILAHKQPPPAVRVNTALCVKTSNMTNKTVFVDFDGVLRIWGTATLSSAERESNVELGAVLKTAFADPLLNHAVTGTITHSQWQQQVESVLAVNYGAVVASSLIAAWENESWEIDRKLLNNLVRVKNAHQLVLVTNATDKLNSDLAKSNLMNIFNFVVNSSSIGVAKPDLEFFDQALEIAGTIAQDAVFVDDSLSHIEAATSMGISSILHSNRAETVSFVESKCT